MPCRVSRDPLGRALVICCSRGSSSRSRLCSSCGRPGATQLCDYKLANGKTCDRPLCTRCAVVQKPEWGQGDRVDFCPAHDRLARKERAAWDAP